MKITKSKIKEKFAKITFRDKFKSDWSYNLALIITFFVGISLIFSTYAWFYASLNVKIEFVSIDVSNESGLFISFDGIEYTSSLVISEENLITNLNRTYPTHTNQWPGWGLYAVSSNGIKTSNDEKFDMFVNTKLGFVGGNPRRLVSTRQADESMPSDDSVFAAFDVFFKNVSGSPMPDNLYFYKGTMINFEHEDDYDDADGIINSMRIGIVKIGSTSSKSDLATVQGLTCNNACESVIYEPNSTKHSEESIRRIRRYNIELINGIYAKTYGVIAEGQELETTGGQPNAVVELDSEHFALQKTITGFDKPIFTVPNGVTKARIYIWIEGQDLDSLESVNAAKDLVVNINFFKDLAGYYYYND